jgi:nitrite reductase (NO-forming)
MGLPVIGLLLVILVANQVGGILIAQDLREDYANLVEDQQAAGGDAAEAKPVPPPVTTAPKNRPKVAATASLSEFAIDMDIKSIPAFAAVTVDVANDGSIPHDLSTGTSATAMLNPGESDTITVNAPGSGSLTFICSVPGHDAAGMTVTIPVKGGEAAAPAEHGGEQAEDPAATTPAYATPDNVAAYSGDKPPLELRDATAPRLPSATHHEFTLKVQETTMQVATDVYQQVWTFGGTVPGPTLRVHVGDTVDVTLVNPKDAALGHSVDFHASQVAWNDEMSTIEPGQRKVYKFTATHAGFFMYHCGTSPALHHIGNGMFGGIIVEPKGGLPPVDHEFAFVQSEYYTGPQGEPGDLTKMAAGASSPDYVVFNGTANQYADHPIQVGVGERIRAWVLNAGPNVGSSFHVVGTIFDTVMKEGQVTVARGNDAGYGSQALDLSPAQGGFVEFTLAEDGLYPLVTHAFNYPGRGALGLFKAGDGGPMPEGGH